VGEGEAHPGMFLAINPGGISTPLIGTPTTDPAFGLPAHWIDAAQKEAAQMAGFTVVDSETVMATHLSHLMQVHAAKLLSRTETQQLVEHVAKLAPKLIEEVVPKMVSITTFQKVLQLLLEESVHIRDIRTIIETLAEHVYVAAALQVHFARLAAGLDPKSLVPVGDGACPCCGGPPVSSMVVGWQGAYNTRFCACALCGTLWHYVRIKCVLCGSTKGIGYQEVEGGGGNIKAETCDACRSYVKVLYQVREADLEPVADDVASLGLALLLGASEYRRGGYNPFLLGY